MKSIFHQNNKSILLASIFFLSIFLTGACAKEESPVQQPAPAPSTVTEEAAVSIPEPKPVMEMITYEDIPFGFSFKYPSTWQGPDVYPSDGGVRIALGTDVVYPYGTSREEQIYTIENSYYITLQYDDQKDPGSDDMYQALIKLQDGASIETARSLTTRVSSVQIGGFEGIEYTTTLAESAQTEAFFMREVVLYDADNHAIRISGSPNNVKVEDGTNWREAYQAVDAANVMNFHVFIDSLKFK